MSNGNGYYGNETNDKVNDSINIGNYLWLATGKGVIKINQTTRERTEYTKENSNVPSNEVESIAANQRADIWIGTYGNRVAVMEQGKDEWKAIPYTSHLFDEKTEITEDGKVLIGGDEDNWLRTNFIHFDVNDTLWVGTSVGLLKLLQEGEKFKWDGPFNPAVETEAPFNVLFIRDVENGIEISGNFGKRGYYDVKAEEIKTYVLPSAISADNTNWRAMTEEVPTPEIVLEEIEEE